MRRRLLIALAISIVVHAVSTLLRVPGSDIDETPAPLQAELIQVPAPPQLTPRPTPQAPAERPPRERPPRSVKRPPPPAAPEAVDAPSTEGAAPQAAEDGTPQAAEDATPAADSGTVGDAFPGRAPAAGADRAAEPAPAALPPSPPETAAAVAREASTAAIPEAVAVRKTLPPVVDLLYTAFLGTQGFIIGTVAYRFEHEGDRYRIQTLGQGRGLVALLYPGQIKVTSRGALTPQGLFPEELIVERGSARRLETARFDRAAGTLTLHGKEPQPLEEPTFDLLTFWLQFYFSPPAGDEVRFRVATTRYVREYLLRRSGVETVVTSLGEVQADVWRRVGEKQDDADAVLFLAPQWNFLPVKVRLSNRRVTVEQVLLGIRGGLEVPETMKDGRRLELPIDSEGREIQDLEPAERRHTP